MEVLKVAAMYERYFQEVQGTGCSGSPHPRSIVTVGLSKHVRTWAKGGIR